jgi:PBP1b-binding outer membrane lipoprotein LpoB
MESKLRRYLYILLLVLFTTGCLDQKDSSESQEDTYQRQVKEYDKEQEERNRQLIETAKQQKAYAESLALAKEQEAEVLRQNEEFSKQLEIGAIQQVKMEKLLKRWELQADRYDAVLDKWEKTK